MDGDVQLKEVQGNTDGKAFLVQMFNLTLQDHAGTLVGDNEFYVQSLAPNLGQDDKTRFQDLQAAERALEEARKKSAGVENKLAKGAEGTTSPEDFRVMIKRSPDEATTKAKELTAALREVSDVRTAFSNVERAAAAKLADLKPGDQDFKGWNAVRIGAMQGAGLIREALPPRYEAVGATWDADLIKRLAPFTVDKDKRAENLENAKKNTQKVTDAGKNLKEATEKYQTRTWDRMSMFRDAGSNSVGISGEDLAKGRKALDEIAEAGIAILDNGGTFKDVDALMKDANLPKEMWPPQLVQAVQAWRKTTRGLQDERVRKIAESSGEGFDKEKALAVVEWVGNYADLDDAKREISKDKDPKDKSGLFKFSEHGNEISEIVTKWLGTGVAGIKGASTVHDLLKNLKGIVDEVRDDKPAKEKVIGVLEKSFESLKNAGSGTKSGLDIANKFGAQALQDALKKVIPGLGVAIAGAEFLTACKDLYASVKTLGKAKSEQKEGFVQFLYDDETTDEAMLGALANDVGAQKTKVAKGSVQVFTKAIDVAGSGAQFGGPHGQLAAAGLAITSSGINLGSKAIFSGISWSAAKKAKKMVLEAQQGSMEAQIELFEKSGFYSKMYLAILAKEKNPLAIKYLIDRGIEEGDLDGPVGVEVLRDAMLKAAGQENEQEISDDLFPRLKKLGNVIGTIGSAPSEVTYEIGKHIVTPTYNPKAAAVTFTENAPVDWEKQWRAGKDGLTKAGLIDVATGIGDVLAGVAKAAGLVETSKQKSEEEQKNALMAAIEALGTAETTVLKCKPEAFDAKSIMKRIPHEPARTSLSNLAIVLGKQAEAYWTQVYQLTNPGSRDGAWTYDVKATFDVDAWTTFWADGVKFAAFPAQDPAIDALKAAFVEQGLFKQAQEGAAQRKPAAAYLAALETLDDALSESLEIEAVSRQQSALKWISSFLLLLNEERRKLDGVLADVDNKAALEGADAKFTDLKAVSGDWSKVWQDALKKELTADPKGKGGKFEDDGGFGKAVSAFETAWKEFEVAKTKAETPPVEKKALQARLKAHRAVEVAAGKLVKAQLEFGRLHRYSVAPLLKASNTLASRVQTELQSAQGTMNELRQKAQFTPASGKTVDGTPNGPVDKLSSQNWRDTYQAAVDSGAVLESKTAKDQISDALQAQKKAKKEYESSLKKDRKTLRKAADAFQEACEETIAAVEYVEGYKNYIANDKMKEELEKIKKAAEAVLDDKQSPGKEIKQIRDGTYQPKKLTFTAKDASEKDWQKNKKIAVAEGLTPDAESGVGAGLKAYAAAVTEVGKKQEAAKNKPPTSKEGLELAAATGQQTRAAELVKALLDKLRNGHADWNGYIEALQKKLV